MQMKHYKGMSQPVLTLTKKIFQALTSIDEKGRKVRRPARLSELEAINRCQVECDIFHYQSFYRRSRCFLIINTIK